MVLVTVRAVKVEALKVCSAYRISETSKLFSTSGAGTLSKTRLKKFSAKLCAGFGATGSSPLAARAAAAMQVGIFASRRMALRRWAASLVSLASGSSRPRKLTQVRMASIGWAPCGKVLMTACSEGLISRSAASAARKSASWEALGSSPFHSR